ncbi:MAG TPA: hypothetical protein VIY86_11495 [Pirellulaceae bacterium]
MEYRAIQVLVIVLWLASMAWLWTTKIVPPRPDQSSPDYGVVGPGSEWTPDHFNWRIECNGDVMGNASTTLIRPNGMPAVLQSEVTLDHVPAGKILTQLSGMWPAVAHASGLPSREFELSLRVRTRLHFDLDGKLVRLRCDVDLGHVADLVRIEGEVLPNGRLSVRAIAGDSLEPSDSQSRVLVDRIFPLQRDALVIDGFAPHPRWAHLREGQVWLVKTLRPFAPMDPVQTLRAQVVRRELVAWNNELEAMYLVNFEDVRAAGITRTQQPLMQMWVRHDGTVARQRFALGGLMIDFVREMDPDDGLGDHP